MREIFNTYIYAKGNGAVWRTFKIRSFLFSGILSATIVLLLIGCIFLCPGFVYQNTIILGGITVSLSLAFMAVVLGYTSLYTQETCTNERKMRDKKHLIFGIVKCYCCIAITKLLLVFIAILLVMMYIGLLCQVNLEEIRVRFYLYADNHPSGCYPQLSNCSGQLTFLNKFVDGTPFLTEDYLKRFGCPSNLDSSAHTSYCYLGYVITNDDEMRSFADAYKKRIATGLPFDTDLDVPPGTGTGGSDKIFRFRLDMTDIFEQLGWDEVKQNSIPMIWERCVMPPDSTTPKRSRPSALFPEILFAYLCRGVSPSTSIYISPYKGVVRAIDYGEGKWPMTEETLRLLWELENLGEIQATN